MAHIISGKYEVISQVGKGGMGVVYQVRHLTLETLLALKVLPAELAEDAGLVRRFHQEARVMAQLNHPNIVRVLDVDREGETHFFVMEYIAGKSLSQYLRERGPLPVPEVVAIAGQVAQALQYAHSHQPPVIHRDIKPANILLEEHSGRVVVTDFGIAKVLGSTERTRTGVVLGTLRYCAPEQLLQDKELDGRADIYSLGLMMYEMAAGQPFFTERDERGLLGRVLQGPGENVPTFAGPIPPEFAAVVARAMARDRERRYPGAAELLRDIEACLTLSPVTSPTLLLGEAGGAAVSMSREQAMAASAGAPTPRTDEVAAARTASSAESVVSGTGPRYWQRVALAVMVVLLVGAGGIAIRNLYFRPSPRQPQGVAPTPPPMVVSSEQAPALPLPDKPSLVVLPFVNMSEDAKQDYFSDGITEDLTTALSQIASLFVIARNSAFTYKGKAVKVQDVGRELGVQYVLEGSVRKADNQVRITAQLVDAPTDAHLWAARYDRPLKDIFALQDEIVQKIVTTLKLQLTLWEQGRLVRKSTDSLEAYDYYLRGVEYWNRSTKEANAQARQMYEKAIALDPKYAGAYAGLSRTLASEWFYQWSQDFQTLEQAFVQAQQAVALDDALPEAHVILSQIYLWKKQHAQAIVEAERAIAFAPNDAEGSARLGFTLNWAGRPEEAIGLIEKALRLNPHYPYNYLSWLGMAYRLTGRYEEAITVLKRAISRNPDFLAPHLHLAVSYSELGREEEARAEVAEILRLSPTFSLEGARQRTLPFKDPAEVERYLAALRKAGLK